MVLAFLRLSFYARPSATRPSSKRRRSPHPIAEGSSPILRANSLFNRDGSGYFRLFFFLSFVFKWLFIICPPPTPPDAAPLRLPPLGC